MLPKKILYVQISDPELLDYSSRTFEKTVNDQRYFINKEGHAIAIYFYTQTFIDERVFTFVRGKISLRNSTTNVHEIEVGFIGILKYFYLIFLLFFVFAFISLDWGRIVWFGLMCIIMYFQIKQFTAAVEKLTALIERDQKQLFQVL